MAAKVSDKALTRIAVIAVNMAMTGATCKKFRVMDEVAGSGAQACEQMMSKMGLPVGRGAVMTERVWRTAEGMEKPGELTTFTVEIIVNPGAVNVTAVLRSLAESGVAAVVEGAGVDVVLAHVAGDRSDNLHRTPQTLYLES
jgi:6,7-dimethyl-8-ribityllumazine synthase